MVAEYSLFQNNPALENTRGPGFGYLPPLAIFMSVKEVVISRFVAGDDIAQGSIGVATPNPYNFTFGRLERALHQYAKREL